MVLNFLIFIFFCVNALVNTVSFTAVFIGGLCRQTAVDDWRTDLNSSLMKMSICKENASCQEGINARYALF